MPKPLLAFAACFLDPTPLARLLNSVRVFRGLIKSTENSPVLIRLRPNRKGGVAAQKSHREPLIKRPPTLTTAALQEVERQQTPYRAKGRRRFSAFPL